MSPVKPINELIVIINNEVPMAFFIGNLANFNKAGIIKKPPPAPINPIKIPTKNNWIVTTDIDLVVTSIASFSLLFFNIEYAAINMTTPNNNIKKVALDNLSEPK